MRRRNCDCSTYGDVVAVVLVGGAAGTLNVVGQGGNRECTRLKGIKFVELCTWALYAYVTAHKCPRLDDALPHSVGARRLSSY